MFQELGAIAITSQSSFCFPFLCFFLPTKLSCLNSKTAFYSSPVFIFLTTNELTNKTYNLHSIFFYFLEISKLLVRKIVIIN